MPFAYLEGAELVFGFRGFAEFIVGPITLSASFGCRGRGFLLHPGQSCWL